MFKKLLVLLTVPVLLHAQPIFKWHSNTITTDINGGAITKDDTIEVKVSVNPNGTSVRSAYFDFQHQKDAIQMLSVTRGEAYSANAGFNVINNYYPNCKFNRNANNTTNNSRTNWNNANYTCNSNTVPYHAINRINISVSDANNLTANTYIKIRFKITNTNAGFPYDSIYFNFGIPFDASGNEITGNTMEGHKGVWVQLSPNANNLVVGEVKHSANVSAGLKGLMRVSVTDTMTQPTEVTNVAVGGNGAFTFAQQLQVNTPYKFRLSVPADSMAALSLAATTVSDFTAAQQEWITQNLDKTFKNTNINKGMKYWAADVNENGEFDGGDLQVLFNAVTGLDTIMTAPAGCAANCAITIPIFYGAEYDNTPLTSWNSLMTGKVIDIVPGPVEYAIINLNGYGAGQTRFYVDMREFPAGVAPSSVKWMNILDVYSGPVTFMSNDATWAFYKVASSFTKATNGTSAYNASIRNVNNGNVDYAISSNAKFSVKGIEKVHVRTTTSEQTVDLRYALKGDVNLSHSSLVTEQQGAIYGSGNLVVPDGRSIDVNLNNVVVTGNNIAIPFTVDTKTLKLTGLQFEVEYDATKVKFEKMDINTPSWVSFVHPMGNVVRFGALDRDLKNIMTGQNLVPFKLHFSALQPGVDLNTSVKIRPTMDAADDKGNQVGVNLNTTVIKLIGANFFRNP